MAKKRKMIGVITGDIIHSRTTSNPVWLPKLKKTLSLSGKSPRTWQIFRGDSFQLEIKDPAEAFLTAIRIKATIKTIRNLDVRMAIGLGDKKYASNKITESDGTAFANSGEKFETLKKSKSNLAIKSPWADFDKEMSVCFALASIPMDGWTANSAELIQILVTHKNLTQKALAKRLGVTQPSVSGRHNRSHFEEIMLLEALFREKVIQLTSIK